MRKRQMKQERESEEDRLKNTSGLGLNSQTGPLPYSRCRKMGKKKKSRPRPLAGTLHNQEKRNFSAWSEACS